MLLFETTGVGGAVAKGSRSAKHDEVIERFGGVQSMSYTQLMAEALSLTNANTVHVFDK